MVVRRYGLLFLAFLYSCAHATEHPKILIDNSIEGCFTMSSTRVSSIEDPVLVEVLIGPKNTAQDCPCKSALIKYSVYQEEGMDVFVLLTGYFSILNTEKIVLPIAAQAKLIFRDKPINIDLFCSDI